MNLAGYFDHIYVVTIARAHERQRRMAGLVAELGAEFFFGADAKELNEHLLAQQGLLSQQKAVENHRFKKQLTGGALGCSLSHRMVYEDVIRKGYKSVLILEDDVYKEENFEITFTNLMQHVPADWQLLYFDYRQNEAEPSYAHLKKGFYQLQRKLGLLNLHPLNIANMYAQPVNAYWSRAGYHDFSSAYAITNKAAAVLLEMQTPLQWLADNLLANAATLGAVSAYAARQKVFQQNSQEGGTLQSMVAPT